MFDLTFNVDDKGMLTPLTLAIDQAVIDGARVLYQEGTLDAMLPVKDLIDRGFGAKGLPDGCAMFGGTFAAKGGIRPASRFEFELEDPVRKRKISHGYDVITMPVLG